MLNTVFDTCLAQLRRIFDPESSGHLIICSIAVGIVSGLGAAAFVSGANWTQEFCFGEMLGYYTPGAGSEHAHHETQLPTRPWAVVLLPVIGGITCGLIVFSFAPEAEGHGTDAMVRAFHRDRGRIRPQVPLVKGVSSIITIGSGGSAGREGPIAQVGAGLGSLLASWFGLGDRDRRLLMLAGAAGGIGAVFRAPLGGALFVCEVLYATTAFEAEAFVPAMMSSITAYSVFCGIHGPGLAFNLPEKLAFHGPAEVPFFVVFALLCSLVGYLYVNCFYGTRNWIFRNISLPHWLKPALGGLVVGVIALWAPYVMAGGYGWIQEAINGHAGLAFMATMCVAKIVATSFTISSGGSGGVFAPSLYIGAMLGGAYGKLCQDLFPDFIKRPEIFVLVGMGGLFAGVAKVPLTAMLMVCEMSGSYSLLIPLMIVCVTNIALLSNRVSLYEEQVAAPVDSPAHSGDFMVDVLEAVHVRDLLRPDRKIELIPHDMRLPQLLQFVAHSTNTYFPVVDSDGKMIGIFTLRDLRAAFPADTAGALVLAEDICTQPVLSVTPDDDLHTALRRLTQKNIDELPVVSPDDPLRVINMISRRDVIRAYHQRLDEWREKSE